jgi:hypothetical protein
MNASGAYQTSAPGSASGHKTPLVGARLAFGVGAPSVYRPQRLPAQAKMAAPPVYRPLLREATKTKSAGPFVPPHAGATLQEKQAKPPVYRPHIDPVQATVIVSESSSPIGLTFSTPMQHRFLPNGGKAFQSGTRTIRSVGVAPRTSGGTGAGNSGVVPNPATSGVVPRAWLLANRTVQQMPKRKRSESEEEEEDPGDGDYTQGSRPRTGTANRTTRDNCYKNNPKAVKRGRRGSFTVPCSECNEEVHVHHTGKEKGVFHPHGKGHNRRMIAKAPPVCHLGDNAAALLGALDDIASSIRLGTHDNATKAMFSEGTTEFFLMRKEIEWGDPTNLGPGHTECNSKHLGGDPTYSDLSDTRKKELRKKVRERLAKRASRGTGFWKNLNKNGSLWGPNHPLGNRHGGGPSGGGGGIC